MRKKKIIIAVLGTDGSGKSTIIEAIAPIISDATGMAVRYEHLRPNYLPSLGVVLGKRTKEDEENHGPVTNPHNSKPSGFVGSMIRLFYYLIDYTYGYYRKIYPSSGIVWIFDRYYYDLLLDQKRCRITLPNWIIRMFGIIVPKPDFTLCLGGESRVIYSRKPETSLTEVSRQMSSLKLFCDKNRHAHWINTDCELSESVAEALKAIGIQSIQV